MFQFNSEMHLSFLKNKRLVSFAICVLKLVSITLIYYKYYDIVCYTY